MPQPSGSSSFAVLARPRLLGQRPNQNETVALVHLHRPPFEVDDNTTFVPWPEIRDTRVTLGSIATPARFRSHLIRGPLLDGLGAGPELLRRLCEVDQTDNPAVAPILEVRVVPDLSGELDLHVFACVRHHADSGCFLRISESPIKAENVEDLRWLPQALALRERHAAALGNHSQYWQKVYPGQEVEYKYTLDPAADIWELATATHDSIACHNLPGFVLKYRDEFQNWNYRNHLFAITEPAEQAGYVSFIPTGDGGYRQKRKWFTTDTLIRREQIDSAPITTTFADYIRDALGVRASALPPFIRQRYDINIESLRTGSYFGIFFDRCHLVEAPDIVLQQCEIEYVRTRSVLPVNRQRVLDELEAVTSWAGTLLIRRQVPAQLGYYSKLSFLLDVTAQRAWL